MTYNCIQAIHFLSVRVFPGNRTHNLCAANCNTLPLSHRNSNHMSLCSWVVEPPLSYSVGKGPKWLFWHWRLQTPVLGGWFSVLKICNKHPQGEHCKSNHLWKQEHSSLKSVSWVHPNACFTFFALQCIIYLYNVFRMMIVRCRG